LGKKINRKRKARKPKNLIEKFGIYYSHLPKKKRRVLLYEIEFFSVLGIILVISTAVILFAYLETLEGLVAGEDTDSVVVAVNVVPAISINSPADITLSPDIEEAGSADGSVIWNVETNDLDGWKLEVNASASPALANGGNSFTDYTETVEGTPEIWSVAASDSEFGFNASGTYAEAGFSGSKYMGFNGGSRVQAAHRNAPSEGSGDETTVNFKAEVGASHSQAIDTYTATITGTATNL